MKNTIAPIQLHLHHQAWSLLFFLFPLSLSAQQSHPYFQGYTIEDGLGGEAINDILVDRFGYIWTAAFSGLHRYDGYEFVNYPADLLDTCALSHPIVHILLEDNNGDLWAGTSGGLNRLDRTTECFQRFFHDPKDSTSLPGNEVIDLVLDTDGRLVILTKSGMATYNSISHSFEQLPPATKAWNKLVSYQGKIWAGGLRGLSQPNQPNSIAIPFPEGKNIQVQAMLPFGDSLLLGTSAGIYYYAPGDTILRTAFPEEDGINQVSIMDIIPAEIHGVKGHWIATRGEGFGWVSIATNDQARYEAGKPKAFSLLDNHVRALAYDDHGSVWIGTYLGLNRLNLSKDQPSYYRSTYDDQDLGDQVLEVNATPDGRIFSYLRWRGLFSSNLLGLRQQPLKFPLNDFLFEKNLNHCYTDRQGTTWFLRGHDQIYQLNDDNPEPTPFPLDIDFTDIRITLIAQDITNDDVFWLATSKGLMRLNRSTRGTELWAPSKQASFLSGDVLSVVMPSIDGKIWLSAGNYYSDYLGYFDPRSKTFTFLPYEVGSTTKIAGGRVKQLAQSPNGKIWAATSQGLVEISPSTSDARLITQVKNVRVGGTESVLADNNGNVWFTGNDQISCYLPTEDRIQQITCPPIGQFANAVGTNLPDGRLLFGGQGGLVAIRPDKVLQQSQTFPRLVINAVLINGLPFQPTQPLAELSTLQLQPQQRALTLRFAGLYFDRNQHIKYAYRLNGSDWRDMGRVRSLSFADLSPGNHQLELRASDGQGKWSPVPHEVSITVAPFWYETAPTWIIVGCGTAVLLFLLIRLLIRRRLEREKLRQLQEVDAFKSRFLTNLTHEFRTPLTLILGPARRLREQARAKQDTTLEREARRIDRQGNRLLGLINQLLNLSKLEAGQLEIERTPVALSPFIKEQVESFRLEAKGRNIALTFEVFGADAGSRAALLRGAVELDKNKVHSIVTNLLANALKYTPAGGAVAVQLSGQANSWSLRVQDTGPGIPPEQRERIFARFARVPGETTTGTGIGLALARELASLLGGSLTLEDFPQPGAVFLLTLPAHHTTASLPSTPALPITNQQAQPKPAAENEKTALVLIVEDDPNVRDFLLESLATSFQVITAPDGQTGLELAFAQIPDLVVSDVMMPHLNGLQLCARLKNDHRTNHLPVLLLTAKTTKEHRLEGLDRGADAYLSKPFDEQELHLRLRNLLTLRDNTAARLREQLLATGSQAPPETQGGTPPEPAFLTDLRQLINARLDDPAFSVGDLEKGLGLSRSQLHRKLTATLGLSASKIINQLRLEAAADRLRQTDDPISSIAYDCGFRDVGYFGKRFRERYGESPSGYRRKRGGIAK